VTDRVARTRPRTPGEEVGQTLVVAPPAATFLQVLELIVCHRVHRVYIMDQGEKPVGVVTCTDVLKVVTREAERQSAAQDAV
jgi:CBS domain-containing protein